MKVGIVGCGLMGRKRMEALGDHTLVGVADPEPSRAKGMAAGREGVTAHNRWESLIERSELDAVIVCTPHHLLAPITTAAVQAGKHVLVEKPAARTPDELAGVITAADRAGTTVHVGYNHRFHPALVKARSIVDSGVLGDLIMVRGRYGHGGRVGYDTEWRADPMVSGGGELLDQGSHLIDLSRWFLGDFAEVDGYIASLYWDMAVEDNGFLLLRNQAGRPAWLHASWTEWKNLFSFELYGRHGKLHVEGLGGSYGIERVAHHAMGAQLGPPDTTIWEFPGADRSWNEEFAAFARAAERGEPAPVTLSDAKAVLDIIAAVYARARS